MKRILRETLSCFSSNTKLSPNQKGPGDVEEVLLRSRRASSIRLCFLPLKGTAGTPSVFMCERRRAVSVTPKQQDERLNTLVSEDLMEMTCASAAFDFFFFFKISASHRGHRAFIDENRARMEENECEK